MGLCTIAMVSSRQYILGLLTAVRSLARMPVPSTCHERLVFVVIWHEFVSDTSMTAAERLLVECAARHGGKTPGGRVSVRWWRADEQRVVHWLRVFPFCPPPSVNTQAARIPVGIQRRCEGQRASMLKLEAFFLPATAHAAVVYLDTDILVLHSPAFVFDELLNNVDRPWLLHTSRHAVCCKKHHPPFNAGFLAFRVPPPATFQQRLIAICQQAASHKKAPHYGDQGVLLDACDMASTAGHAHIRHEGSLVRGPYYAHHLDWHLNFWPYTFFNGSRPSRPLAKHESYYATQAGYRQVQAGTQSEPLAMPLAQMAGAPGAHRIVHWLGVRKPWGSHGEFSKRGYTLPHQRQLDDHWRQGPCSELQHGSDCLVGRWNLSCGSQEKAATISPTISPHP